MLYKGSHSFTCHQTRAILTRRHWPGHPSVGRCNEYRPKGGDALWLGVKAGMGHTSLYSQPQSINTLWMVLTAPTHRGMTRPVGTGKGAGGIWHWEPAEGSAERGCGNFFGDTI